jgi:hypothetical protein
VSRLFRQCGILSISQPYRLSRLVTGMAFYFQLLHLFLFTFHLFLSTFCSIFSFCTPMKAEDSLQLLRGLNSFSRHELSPNVLSSPNILPFKHFQAMIFSQRRTKYRVDTTSGLHPKQPHVPYSTRAVGAVFSCFPFGLEETRVGSEGHALPLSLECSSLGTFRAKIRARRQCSGNSYRHRNITKTSSIQ